MLTQRVKGVIVKTGKWRKKTRKILVPFSLTSKKTKGSTVEESPCQLFLKKMHEM